MGLKFLGQVVIKLFGPSTLINGSVRHLFWSRGAVNRESWGTTAVNCVPFQLWAFFKLKWRLLASVFFYRAYFKIGSSSSIVSNFGFTTPRLLGFLFPQTCHQIEFESVFQNSRRWSVYLKMWAAENQWLGRNFWCGTFPPAWSVSEPAVVPNVIGRVQAISMFQFPRNVTLQDCHRMSYSTLQVC